MSLKCGSGVFGYRFLGGRITQHGGDFGVVALSIHNYSGATFVSWNYYKAGLITEFFKGLRFKGERLVLGDLALLRIPTTWVRALSMITCEALALLRAVSVQQTISAAGICLGGRAKWRPLVRTDI